MLEEYSNSQQKQLAIDELKKTNQILSDAIFEVSGTKYGIKSFVCIEKIHAKFREKIEDEISKLLKEK